MDTLKTINNINLNNEFLIISFLMKNLKIEMFSLEERLFQNNTARSIYLALKDLKDKNLDLNIDTILLFSKKYNPDIEYNNIKTIYEEYNDFSNIDYHKSILESDYNKNVILKGMLEDLTIKASRNDVISTQDILSTIQNISSKISLLVNDSVLKNAKQLVDTHLRVIEERDCGRKLKSLGFKVLNDKLTRPAAPKEITIVASLRNSGKTLLKQLMINNLIHQNVPIVDFSLEMSEESDMDRMIAIKSSIQMKNINKSKIDKNIKQKVISTLNEFSKIKNYLYTDNPILSFEEIDSLLYYAKDMFRKQGILGVDEYMFVTIDLLNMVSDYKDQTPVDILKATDQLHKIIKKHNVHCLGLVQINENKLRGNKLWKVPEDLDEYNPNLEDIYGGSAYAQRARTVFILHRPLFIKKRYFPELSDLWDSELDIINCHCVKQSDGDLFLQKFLFDKDSMRIYPYIENFSDL